MDNSRPNPRWFWKYGSLAVALASTPAVLGSNWLPTGPRGDLGATPGADANGRVASIQVHERSGYLFIGASSGGIWRTDPSTGLSPVWVDLGKNLPNPAVGAFAVHPLDSNDLLVGTGDTIRYPGQGLFHTIDGGAHWARVIPSSLFPLTPIVFYRIAYQPGGTDVVLAASNLGLLRSENGPNGPWQNALPGLVSDFVFDPSDGNTVYACSASAGFPGPGVYKSTNGGKVWALLPNSFTSTITLGRIAICRSQPKVLAVVWGGPDSNNGINIQAVVKSTDGGTNWADITGPNCDSLKGGGANAALWALCIGIAPKDPNQIYVGSGGLYRSFDGGSTWEQSQNCGGISVPGSISRHGDFTQAYFDPLADNTLWLCSDGGVYRYLLGDDNSVSFNGDNVNGLQISQIYKIDARRNIRMAAMQDDGVNGSLDSGVSWKQFEGEDGAAAVLSDFNDQNPAFWDMHGLSHPFPWTVARGTFNSSPNDIVQPNPKYGSLYYDRFSDRIFAMNPLDTNYGSGAVFSYPALANAATDGRLEVAGPMNSEGVTGNYLDGQTFYTWVRGTPTTYNVAALRRSGQTWNVTYALVGGPNLKNPVNRVLASRKMGGECWAALNGAWNDPKVFHSTDYGATWTDISGNLTGLFLDQTTVLFEGFEANFPNNGWSVGDANSSGTTAYWASENPSFGGVSTHSGASKGYCAGSAYLANSSEPHPTYFDEMTAYMKRGISLVGFNRAELRFWYRIPSIESCCAQALVMIDGAIVWSSNQPTPDWKEQVVDLQAYLGANHMLFFEFVTGGTLGAQGFYLDDIKVTGYARPISAVTTIAASPSDSNELYVGTDVGAVYRTLDGGAHWEAFQEQLPFVQITDMIYLVDESHAATDKLLIGTFGRGMYERSLDHPGPVYVDQRRVVQPWLGTIEFPLPTLDWGISATPNGGRLILNGSQPYSGNRTLTKPMTISAYEFDAHIGP